MADKQSQQSPKQQPAPAPAPARIKLIYESRDGRLCLFQDANGHLTAVRASQLA